MVRRQEQPSLVLVKRQIISSDFHHLACEPGRVQREDRITSCCDDNVSGVIGQVQRILEQPGAAVALEKMHVVDDQRDGLETQGISDPAPQLPVSVISAGSRRTTGADVCNPLPQQCGLAIASGGGHERDGPRSASTELQKPSTSDHAALRDRRPSAGRPSLSVGALSRLYAPAISARQSPEDAPFLMLGGSLSLVQLDLCRTSTSSTPKSCMACRAP